MGPENEEHHERKYASTVEAINVVRHASTVEVINVVRHLSVVRGAGMTLEWISSRVWDTFNQLR